MKYLSYACQLLVFLFLLSCDQSGGDLPSPSQKNKVFINAENAKVFSTMTERFREFLKTASPNTFSDINSGYNFGEDEQGCNASSSLYINGSPYELSSTNCYYYYNQEDNFEGFSISSYYITSQNFRFFVSVHFTNMGIPQTGTYSGEVICSDDYSYCYHNVSIGVYLVSPENELVEFYYANNPMVEVSNKNDIVSASFDEIFYFYDDYTYELTPVFNASGAISCCN